MAIEIINMGDAETVYCLFQCRLGDENIEVIYRANRKSMPDERVAESIKKIKDYLERLIAEHDEWVKKNNGLENKIKTCGKYIKKGSRNPDRYKVR